MDELELEISFESMDSGARRATILRKEPVTNPYDDSIVGLAMVMIGRPEAVSIGNTDPALLGWIGRETRVAYLTKIQVSPSFRSRGVGSAMLQRAERIAAQFHCTKMFLYARSEAGREIDLLRFYQRHGLRLLDESVFGTLLGRTLDP